MARSNQTGEFNTFVGGLVTEASPLTFPENASIDEANFVLERTGKRRRRLGMDVEPSTSPYPVSYGTNPVGSIAVNAFEWGDVAGVSGKTFIACQIHDRVYIVDRTDSSLESSSWVKDVITITNIFGPTPRATFSSIDGKLVIAYGRPHITVVSYDSAGDSFSKESRVLKVRDLFSVGDTTTPDGDDLLSPEYINYRPLKSEVGDSHYYNLRNQGWAVPRLNWTTEYKNDPIVDFTVESSGQNTLPSNADTPVLTIYPNTGVTDKNSERFNSEAAARQEPAKTQAARGHFVIDLLSRGPSRETEYERSCDPVDGIYKNANSAKPTTSVPFLNPTISLPADVSEGGVRVVSEFAGRVWYGGFSSELYQGDSQSPNLASYVFYSQQVQHDAQITRCYQEGDPTDIEAPDRLDTDGGFVRLSGAYNIQAMENIGTGLMVFAENGVWFISGSDSGTFNANNQMVTKVSEHGTLSPASLAVVDSTIMYWADDAIYHIQPNQVGAYETKELSVNIRTLYQDIGDADKLLCQGVYDKYDKKVRWLYGSTELVFDIVLGAFYKAEIKASPTTSKTPVVPITVSPYSLAIQDVPVVSDTDDVLSGVDEVVMEQETLIGGFRSTAYLTLINSEDVSNTSLTFSTYNNSSFKDWGTEDAAAYMVTGYIGTGDYSRFKQVPYIYFHLLRTESGFTDDGDDFIVNNESSCLVQSQWDWANSEAYGKWGTQFQAYRYKRRYTPTDVTDNYDYGTSTIVTKNKLRGRGRVVSLLINSEEEKDLQLLGWSMTIGVNGSV